MVIGIGIDLIESARLERALREWGARFEQRVFSDGELAACAGRVDRVQALAARFAAKEACLKALGTGVAQGLSLRQVEVVRASGSAPRIVLHGAAAEKAKALGVTNIQVSLTHQKLAAAAVVILEG